MGLHYLNLDDATRKHMLSESKLGNHYISPRLHPQGAVAWVALFDQALASHNDDWLEREIISRRLLSAQEKYTTKSGQQAWRNVNIPFSAQVLAQGEFNRFYLRGLCIRAIEEGIDHLVVYRARASATPRPESEAKIGSKVPVDRLLEILRSVDFVSIEKSLFSIPSGPNSGLSARLP
jgi:hypothetical protein